MINSEARVGIYEMMRFHQQRAVSVCHQTGRTQASQNRFQVKFGKQGWGDLGEDVLYIFSNNVSSILLLYKTTLI